MGNDQTLAAIVNVVAQINPLIALAVSAINSARMIRDAAKAAGVEVKYFCADHPDQVGEEGGTCPVCGKTFVSSLPSDAELIAKFATSATALRVEASEAKAWAESLKSSQPEQP